MRLSDVKAWLAGLFSSERADRELDDEIDHHLQLEMDRQRRDGHDHETARRRALEKFGDPRRIAQATRDERATSLLEETRQDVRLAVRVLRRQPSFTTLALVTLAIGIGTSTVAFALLDSVLLRPLPFAEPDRLIMIRELNTEHKDIPPSFPNFADWRERARSFSGVIAALLPNARTIVVGAEPLRVDVMGVSRGFFKTLGVTPVIGREFAPDENVGGGPALVMVSHRFWTERLGGRRALGSLRIGDRTAEIIGVLPPSLPLFDDADVFVPNEQNPNTGRTNANYIVIARLGRNATLVSAQTEMTALTKAMLAEYGTPGRVGDVAMTPLHEWVVNDHRATLYSVFAASGLLLLIACTNLMSAQLARGIGRMREMAIRASLGASSARLVRQLVVESAVLAVAGALLGVAGAFALVRVLRVVGASSMRRMDTLAIDGRSLAFAVAIALLTVIVIGVYPALRLASRAPGDVLRGASKNASAASRSRAWPLLIGFEIAVAVVLVVGSTLLVRTMRNIMTSDAGLDPRGLLTAALSSSEGMSQAETERMLREIAAVPGVSGAAMVTRYPLVWWAQSGPVFRPSDPPAQWPAMAGFRVVSPNYFGVARQRVLQGRDFTPADDTSHARVAIITPGIAESLWPNENPIGKTIRTSYLSGQWLTVVGVVAEASHWSMQRGVQNEIFVPLAQQPERARNQLIIVVRTDGETRALIPLLRAHLREAMPATPATLETMSDRIAQSASDRNFAMTAFAAFAAVALILAGLGIYGVMSYAVRARTHEIGVRIALGASPLAMQIGVLRGAALIAVAGVAVGLLGSLVATTYLESLLYEVTRFDPAAYWGASVFLVSTAVIGAFVPAWRSSRVDPLVALRGPD